MMMYGLIMTGTTGGFQLGRVATSGGTTAIGLQVPGEMTIFSSEIVHKERFG